MVVGFASEAPILRSQRRPVIIENVHDFILLQRFFHSNITQQKLHHKLYLVTQIQCDLIYVPLVMHVPP